MPLDPRKLATMTTTAQLARDSIMGRTLTSREAYLDQTSDLDDAFNAFLSVCRSLVKEAEA